MWCLHSIRDVCLECSVEKYETMFSFVVGKPLHCPLMSTRSCEGSCLCPLVLDGCYGHCQLLSPILPCLCSTIINLIENFHS